MVLELVTLFEFEPSSVNFYELFPSFCVQKNGSEIERCDFRNKVGYRLFTFFASFCRSEIGRQSGPLVKFCAAHNTIPCKLENASLSSFPGSSDW